MRFDLKARPVRKRVWNAGRFFLLAAALAITFGVFFLAALRVATRAREVKVPDLRGMSVAEATTALGAARPRPSRGRGASGRTRKCRPITS